MEEISCHSNQSSYLIKTKSNTHYVKANVLSMYKLSYSFIPLMISEKIYLKNKSNIFLYVALATNQDKRYGQKSY